MTAAPAAIYEVHEGTEGLASLRSAWESLETTGADHIFQTYEQAELWQRTVGAPTGAKPLVITLSEGDRVVGIFPACRLRQNGMPIVSWIGAPRILDYGDVIFDTSAATSVDAFVGESLRLIKRRAFGALVYLTNVREDARAHDALLSRLRLFRQTAAPYLPIKGTWDEFLAALACDQRHEFNRRLRRISEKGTVDFRILGPGDPGIAPTMARLVEFQRSRWGGPLNRTSLFDERYVRFRAAQMEQSSGRLLALSLDGTVIAASLGLIYRGRFNSTVPGYDSDYSRFSPGTLMDALSIKAAFDNGWDPYDFGWGDEAHKYRWTDADVKLSTFVSDDAAGALLIGVANARHRMIDGLAALKHKRAGKPKRTAAK